MSSSQPNLPIQVAIAGEALIDMVAGERGQFQACLGGAAFNLARALARQGVAVSYLNPLSRDQFGQQFVASLVHEGVVISGRKNSVEPTSIALVQLDQTGHPSYSFYREGVADRSIDAAQLNQICSDMTALEIVCTGCLALAPADSEHYLPWLQTQRTKNKFVVIDVNMRPSVMSDLGAYRDNVMSAIQYADLIKASDEDLLVLELPGRTVLEQANYLFQHSRAQMIAITLGKDGAYLLTRKLKVHAYESSELEIIDTVGAGDSFLAGLLANLLTQSNLAHDALPEFFYRMQFDLDALIRHAIASASLNVQQQGCQPPSLNEVGAWLSRNSIQISGQD